jgi:hypothetical protein
MAQVKKANYANREQWYMSIIPALRRLRQEDHQFEDSLGYLVSSRPVSKKKQNETG